MKKGKILLVIVSAILGIVFLFSAWSKTMPVRYFEYIISSQLHLPQTMTAVAARFFIGLEAALGLLLAANVFGHRRWVLKTALGLLIIFSVHLVYLLISQGNDVNCGCMGNIAPMSPGVSLLKNAALAAGLILLLRRYRNADGSLPDEGPVLNAGSFVLTALLVAVPFFVFPLEKQLTMPLSRLYTTTTSEHPVAELRRGKHILCFMSLSCSHCRDAATVIARMKKNNPSLPFYFALAGGTDSTRAARFTSFMDETKANDIPYHFLGQKDFVEMIQLSASSGVPVILWMQDTLVVRKVNSHELNQKEIEAWIAQ